MELINLLVSLKTSHWFISSSQPVIQKKTDIIYHFKSITQGCKGKTLGLHCWENKIRCRLRPVFLATNERQACFVSYFCNIHRCYRIIYLVIHLPSFSTWIPQHYMLQCSAPTLTLFLVHFGQMMGNSWRITNRWDLVPQIVPSSIAINPHAYHTRREVYYDYTLLDPANHNYTICMDNEVRQLCSNEIILSHRMF